LPHRSQKRAERERERARERERELRERERERLYHQDRVAVVAVDIASMLGCHYFSDLLRRVLAFTKVRSSRGRKKSKAGADMDEKNDAPLSYIWKIRERVYSPQFPLTFGCL
jgi:hypothetical protein